MTLSHIVLSGMKLSFIKLIVIMLRVIVLSGMKLSFIKLIVIMLSHCAYWHSNGCHYAGWHGSVIMMIFKMLSFITLSVIMLSVILLIVILR